MQPQLLFLLKEEEYCHKSVTQKEGKTVGKKEGKNKKRNGPRAHSKADFNK